MATIRQTRFQNTARTNENYQQTFVEESARDLGGRRYCARARLERCMSGEMLEFPNDVFGIALNLEEDQVGAVLLGDHTRLKKATR